MSLKDLISTLIESAFTNKKGFIADNASPATSEIDISSNFSSSVSSWATVGTYTAPSSGWVVVSCQQAESWAASTISTSVNNSDVVNGNTFPIVRSVPVAKGQTATVMGNGLSNITVKFIPLGGGELIAFLRKLFGVYGEVCYG